MSEAIYAVLDARGLIAVEGEDRIDFLQGLVSNDVTKVGEAQAAYGAFLTAQGKYLHDFFMVQLGEKILLDCEADRLADFKRRLSMYKLRAKVSVSDVSGEFAVAAAFGPGALGALGLANEAGRQTAYGEGAAYVDPRLATAGARLVLPKGGVETLADAGLAAGSAEDYDALRLRLGLADGSRDMEVEKAILLENGFDELNGVDWQKGCYMGQELTARTKYRGLVKKRLLPVAVDGPLPEPGSPLMLDGKEAGEMRSGQGNQGLALIRLEALEKASSFTCGDATLTPQRPEWVVFQE